MCGIVGIWADYTNIEALAGICPAVESLKHRGPDSWDVKQPTAGLMMAHRRLAIIDISPAGAQPMQRGPLTITYNGEIFNARALAASQFPNERWRGTSDTEILLALWEKFGSSCLHLLDGMFAFAVWDARTRVLTLARDRAGEKPLYHTWQNGVFAFASELKALTHVPGLDWAIDETAFGEYMAFRYVPAPRSIIKGIQKLQPGHILTFDGKTVTTRRWYAWEVEPQPEAMASQKGFREAVDATEAALIEAMRGRLISDRPLGMFLSGGIDSSLVCAIAKRLGTTPRTFSIGFEGDAKSEHQRAAQTAQHLGCEHHEHIFSVADFESVAGTIGAHMDEPNGDRSCVPTYLLSRFTGETARVALSGDGGDELFGGYQRYFTPVNDAVGYYNERLPVAGIEWANHQAEQAAALFCHPGRDSIHALRQLDFNRYLTLVLAKMDRMSMQHSLEVRTPYLAPAVLEIARMLPTAYLKQGSVGKLVLRELAARYVDRDLAALPKKGFGMPGSVFADNSKLIGEQYAAAFDTIKTLSVNPVGWHQASNINSIWSIIVFAQWARAFGKPL